MALPNFLIAGMAKCGTSSLAQYLQQHYDVFISRQKEPRYLSSQCMTFPINGPKGDKLEDWYVKDFDAYKAMFSDAKEKAVGEASADTLYFHQCTIPVIKEKLGDPKIIIILRNPAKRAFSAYQHLVRDEREEGTFQEALDKEDYYVENNFELIHHYRAVSHYYEPVKAFLASFSDVLVLLNDDLQKRPKEVLKKVCEFLEVASDFEFETELKFNESGIPKNRALHDNLQQHNSLLRKLIRPIARVLLPTEEKRRKMVTWLSGRNLSKMEFTAEEYKALQTEFIPEIDRLEKLINQDLSMWRVK
jgi:hypothetical protein